MLHIKNNMALLAISCALILQGCSEEYSTDSAETVQNQTEETEGNETEGGETEGSETEGSETEGSETEGSETEGSETEGSETEDSETEGSETEGSETEGNESEESDTDTSLDSIVWEEVTLTSYSGHYDYDSFVHQAEQDYEFETTFETLTNIDDGEYVLRAFTWSSGGQEVAQIFAKNCGGADSYADIPETQADYWSMIETSAIEINGGSCTIGFRSKGKSDQWLLVDDFELLPKPVEGVAPTNMAVGGDITYRNLTTSVGGQWADQEGNVKDVLEILEDHAFNLARIRIYNNPGTEVELADGLGGTYLQKVQPGYQDLADAVITAKAAKEHGMTLFVSLHYSDFWTNPSLQTAPEGWPTYIPTGDVEADSWGGAEGGLYDEDFAEIKTQLYDYTKNVMQTLVDNGVTPEFISIGNEINNAVAGVSRFFWKGSTAETNWLSGYQYYTLLNEGYKAVKDVSPTTKVVIHLTDAGKDGIADHDVNGGAGVYDDWITKAKTFGLNYDLIGTSIYPFWTGLNIGQMSEFVSHISTSAGKNVFICEVGYPWTLETQFGEADMSTLIKANDLDPDGPENYGATPQGQLTYMKEFFRAMYNTGVVEGIAYWDPINIDVEGAGWAVGEKSSVEDTSFFDYQTPHRALESLTAFYSY